MLLIFSPVDDSLAVEVAIRARRRGLELLWIRDDMLERYQFAYSPDDTYDGYVRSPSRQVSLRDVSLSVVRPSRLWRPKGFSLSDEHFVYHETIAAWIGLWEHLPCVVANRFDTRWWVGDPSYVDELRTTVSDALSIGLSDQRSSVTRTIYLTRLDTLCNDTERPHSDSSPLTGPLTGATELMEILGLELIRLELDGNSRLVNVNLRPSFTKVEAPLLGAVADQLLERRQ